MGLFASRCAPYIDPGRQSLTYRYIFVGVRGYTRSQLHLLPNPSLPCHESRRHLPAANSPASAHDEPSRDPYLRRLGLDL